MLAADVQVLLPNVAEGSFQGQNINRTISCRFECVQKADFRCNILKSSERILDQSKHSELIEVARATISSFRRSLRMYNTEASL